MLLLTSVNDVLRLNLSSSGSIAIHTHASYADWSGNSASPNRTLSILTASGQNTIVSAPVGNNQRNIKTLHIRNTATTSVLVTINLFNGSTAFDIFSCTLLTGESIVLTESSGWQVFDASGQLKTALTAALGYRLLSVSRPNQAKVNSAAGDSDYNTIYTVPANQLVAQSWLRVLAMFKITTGAAAVSESLYIKLGGTKCYTQHFVSAPLNSLSNRWFAVDWYLVSAAAPGAAVNVDTSVAQGTHETATMFNATNSQNFATNSALALVIGITWGASGGLDTLTLVNVLVEQKN